MKSFFFTLLILGSAFVAYDYFLAAPWERVIFKKGPPPATAKPKSTIPDHVIEDDGPPVPKSKPVATTTYTPTIPALPSEAFVPPTIPSVEALTQNWTVIPPQAFPRSVTLKKDLLIKMSVGASTLKAGATAFALSSQGPLLTLAPTETSAARGTLAVTDTDFPEQIQATYAKWKVDQIERAKAAWTARKTIKTGTAIDKSTVSNGQGINFTAEGKPVQNANGSYNLLLAVISAGHISDVDPNKVVHWSEPSLQTIDEKPTWVIDVRYLARTIFGPMEVDSHAHVREGRLVRWVYDSGEPLP